MSENIYSVLVQGLGTFIKTITGVQKVFNRKRDEALGALQRLAQTTTPTGAAKYNMICFALNSSELAAANFNWALTHYGKKYGASTTDVQLTTAIPLSLTYQVTLLMSNEEDLFSVAENLLWGCHNHLNIDIILESDKIDAKSAFNITGIEHDKSVKPNPDFNTLDYTLYILVHSRRMRTVKKINYIDVGFVDIESGDLLEHLIEDNR